MNYMNIKKYDTANGPGVRITIFVSGCPHMPKCKNCFNPETHDFKAGKLFSKEVIDELLEESQKSYIQGITLLGGEPMALSNQEGLLEFVEKFKELCPDKDVWCFTGYEYEKHILKMYEENSVTKKLLPLIDVLVDGLFDERLKDPRLVFKGSSNQKIIMVKKSLDTKNTILWEKPEYK